MDNYKLDLDIPEIKVAISKFTENQLNILASVYAFILSDNFGTSSGSVIKYQEPQETEDINIESEKIQEIVLTDSQSRVYNYATT